MTFPVKPILSLLDQIRVLLLGEPIPAKGPPPSLRGIRLNLDWTNIQMFYAARKTEADAVKMDVESPGYEELLAHLVDQREEPAEGKRDTRRQHARLSLDKFLEIGLLKRDGDIISMP